MQLSTRPPVLLALALLVSPIVVFGQSHPQVSPKILSAKSAYFDDRTGSPPVGAEALGQLKKWGRFKIVDDRKQAELIILLSADPYKGGYIIFASGETGKVNKDGTIDVDPIPTFGKLAPVREVYLTVIDPKTGKELWSDSRQWGGLLTGFHSAGKRLVKKLAKQVNRN